MPLGVLLSYPAPGPGERGEPHIEGGARPSLQCSLCNDEGFILCCTLAGCFATICHPLFPTSLVLIGTNIWCLRQPLLPFLSILNISLSILFHS